MDEETYEQMLVAVLDYYGFPEPGYGERSARCPVHDDSHASASINRTKGVFNCHACGGSGNAVHIVMSREGYDYRQALEFIRGLGVSTELKAAPTRTPRRGSTRWVPPRLRSAG